ncbi:anti-sigma factor [Pleurocapsa sp. FMAR1]|uniref:anti-sigma factor n=1 Tax=Pleurocapsa sp. FMAR1 TaxID=3040204 RepID=UPI0029C8FE31|nr:anti-sigma factor [Pleurocapsa sp. FMAR1]
MSTLPPECEQLLVSGYVLGNLSPAEALLFKEMLTENPDLIEQVTAMQEALDLAYAPPEVTPTATLRDRILIAASSQTANTQAALSTASNSESTVTSKSKLPWNKILGVIAIAAITTLGIANYRLWESIQTAQTTDTQTDTQSDQLTYLLKSEDAAKKSTAKLVVSPDRLNATLNVNNLPPLPPEKAYALWTVVGKDVPYTTDEKGAILTAVFQVNDSGYFAQEIAVPQPYLEPKTIKIVAITVEDVSAPQAHQGSILMSTQNN